jgi:hypothetical protein
MAIGHKGNRHKEMGKCEFGCECVNRDGTKSPRKRKALRKLSVLASQR